jgi:hypothetical protein
MTGMHLVTMLGYSFAIAFSWWMWISVGRMFLRTPDLVNRIRSELHPFRWLFAIGMTVCKAVEEGHTDPWRLAGMGFDLIMCWFFRHDDDDDRWKRRLKDAGEKVAELAGRLVVVPATSGGAA